MINGDQVTPRAFIKMVVLGHYHMWYLYMIIGIYMVVPILRKITGNSELSRYFLVLSVLFTFVIPTIASIPAFAWVSKVTNKLMLHITVGYASYFVLGKFLNDTEIIGAKAKVVYLLGLLGTASTILITAKLTYDAGVAKDYYGNFTIGVALQAIAIFLFVKNHRGTWDGKKFISTSDSISKYTFGIYLVHPFFIEVLRYFLGITPNMCLGFISVPLFAAGIFLLSLGTVALMRKAHFLRQFV